MSEKRDAQIQWINEVLQSRHWRAADWARRAGVHHSTLSKFLSNENTEAVLTEKTIKKLAHSLPGEPVVFPAGSALPVYLNEPDAAPWQMAKNEEPHDETIKTLVAGSSDLNAFTINSAALAAIGIMPKDVLIVDARREPEDGDVVCVQLYDRQGSATTTFRVYQTPFVTTAPLGAPAARPVLVDNDRVALRGTVISVLRAL